MGDGNLGRAQPVHKEWHVGDGAVLSVAERLTLHAVPAERVEGLYGMRRLVASTHRMRAQGVAYQYGCTVAKASLEVYHLPNSRILTR